MPPPHGFDYTTRGDGTVVITHHGRPATTLRGPRAAAFLAEVDSGDDQEVMARWTATTATATSARRGATRGTEGARAGPH